MPNTSYSLLPILLKLHKVMCFGHGLKTCIWFGYNIQIIFVTYSDIITINICRQYVPCEGNAYYKFYIFRWFHGSLKFLAGDINSLHLLVQFCIYEGGP